MKLDALRLGAPKLDKLEMGQALSNAKQVKKAEPPDPKKVEVAKNFEAIFLRQILSSMQKAGSLGSKSGGAPGQGAYASMIVDAMSDAVTRGGGLGMADQILRGMTDLEQKAKGSASAATPDASQSSSSKRGG